MPPQNDENEPLTPIRILDAFAKDSRIILLYGLPLSVAVYLLRLISWDSGYAIILLSLYTFGTILAKEDKETLDESVKTILVSLTTDIGYYYLSNWISYMLYENYNLAEKFEQEGNQYLLQVLLLLQEYITFVYRIAFFRICVYSFVVGVVLIAKVVTKLSV